MSFTFLCVSEFHISVCCWSRGTYDLSVKSVALWCGPEIPPAHDQHVLQSWLMNQESIIILTRDMQNVSQNYLMSQNPGIMSLQPTTFCESINQNNLSAMTNLGNIHRLIRSVSCQHTIISRNEGIY